MKRLLTIGHSYVVALNRRLAHEMAVQGSDRWEVTAAAPAEYSGDLRPIRFETIASEACRVVSVPVRFDRHPHVMRYGRGIRELLDEPWDVVHCWEEPYVAAGAQIARLSPRRARFVFATFQNLAKRYPQPFRWMERRVLRRADGWIAFGRTVHETQSARNGYRSIPSKIIPPGVDVARFKPDCDARARIRARLGWDHEVPVVGFVGRFAAAKGTSVLTAALERMTGSWHALFVGGGDELPSLQAFADRHPARVRVVTDVPHDDVPAWLNAMDVLCAPSQTTPAWREQFGRMLIEAMACGVPVAASRSGEIPYVVDGAGTLLSEADVGAWTSALESLLKDKPARDEHARRGLARARERFAWPVVAAAHLDFFDELTA